MRRILLVEDNPMEVRLIREALRDMKRDVEIEVAEDGEKAVAALMSEKSAGIGLILLDIKLPRKRGTEVLKEIKQDSGLAQIPVVVLTSSDSDMDRQDAIGLGADCFLSKPVRFEEYREILTKALNFAKP